MPKVLSINISAKKQQSKDKVQVGEFIENHGLKGDAHAGDWHRQISLLANESIEKMKLLGLHDLDFGIFAENVTTEGIVLHTLPLGTRLTIGEVVLEITQIGKECHTECEIFQKVGKCVMPKEGVFAKVLRGGLVKAGDEIDCT